MKSAQRFSASFIPRGFRFSAVSCGLKKSGLDLGLILSEKPASAAAVFTKNLVQAAPVIVSREHLRRAAGEIRAIVLNSGNANCATGAEGIAASQRTAAKIARELGCSAEQILICSTGVIGVPLRVEQILSAAPALLENAANNAASFAKLARAMMTTDTRPKWAAANCTSGGKRVRLLGCAKGAGMIHPNMATMLAFIVTDAAARPPMLQQMLREACRTTFNAITVDGDTSTNDTLTILANGASGARSIREGSEDHRRFSAALESICRSLALQIVADGEGAQRMVEIEVCGAASVGAAEKIAHAIATSPLVKTALAGGDPNWGRILAAAGRAGVKFDPNRAEIRMAGIVMCRSGRAQYFNERTAHRKLLGTQVPIVVDFHSGGGRARVWTCDFTSDYVRINASYRS